MKLKNWKKIPIRGEEEEQKEEIGREKLESMYYRVGRSAMSVCGGGPLGYAALHGMKIAMVSESHCRAAPVPMEREMERERGREKERVRVKVGVVGAGAAGLVAAREMAREGHHVVLFEQNLALGGTWLYSKEVDDSQNQNQNQNTIVRSSLYDSLRTNLPRELMSYLDFPFLLKQGEEEGRDPRRYPGHEEVLRYLQDFATHFDLLKFIRFGREVIQLTPLFQEEDKEEEQQEERSHNLSWLVKSRGREGLVEEETFNAVVVCNGHFTYPNFASIPGIENWPHKQVHSHSYRSPEPFKDQVVVVIGNGASGVDITLEIANVALEIHWSSRSWDRSINTSKAIGGHNNIWLHPMVNAAHEDGSVSFEDGSSVIADVIMYCTGYLPSFPFLDTKGIVKITDQCVGPLYQHVFPPLLAPSLSFIGLPQKVVPFPLFELQSKWIAKCLSGIVVLPKKQEMLDEVEEYYAQLEAKGLSKRYAHNLGSSQYDYANWLAKQCECGSLELWRKEMYERCANARKEDPNGYRDKWDDQLLHEFALAQLNKIDTVMNGQPMSS